MRSDGKSCNYFLKNKLTKLANFVQFKRMLVLFEKLGGMGPKPPLFTPLELSHLPSEKGR